MNRLIPAACGGLLWLAAAGADAAQPPGHEHHRPRGEEEAEPTSPDRGAGQPPAAPSTPLTPIPPLTDEDRAAAFPPVAPRKAADARIDSLVLLERIEWEEGGLRVESKGWVGGVRDRLRFRAEGRAGEGGLGETSAGLFYGRAVTPFWDLVGGLELDSFSGGDTRLALGVSGLAPYRFEVEALALVGPGGRAGVHLEAEYSLLLTNRLILQPVLEFEAERGGEGPPASAELEGGLRLRYEVRREFAPYAGIVWNRRFGDGEPAAARLTFGARVWF